MVTVGCPDSIWPPLWSHHPPPFDQDPKYRMTWLPPTWLSLVSAHQQETRQSRCHDQEMAPWGREPVGTTLWSEVVQWAGRTAIPKLSCPPLRPPAECWDTMGLPSTGPRQKDNQVMHGTNCEKNVWKNESQMNGRSYHSAWICQHFECRANSILRLGFCTFHHI